MAKKVETKSKKKTGKRSAKRKSGSDVEIETAGKAEKGKKYMCEVCGCELVCEEDSAGELMCCSQPMCVIYE